jgi:hypothetical protein
MTNPYEAIAAAAQAETAALTQPGREVAAEYAAADDQEHDDGPAEIAGGHVLGFNPCGSPGCHMCPPGEPRMNPVSGCCDRYPACYCPF